MQTIDDIKGDAETDAERKEFWEAAYIPYNDDWKENGAEFVNPVTVADQFILATAEAARMAYQGEIISNHLATLGNVKADFERQLVNLRREIIADHYDKMTKTAPPEVQSAFIFKSATKTQRDILLNLEADLENVIIEMEVWKPRLATIEKRLRRLDHNMEWATQYLNFDKHVDRIKNNSR